MDNSTPSSSYHPPPKPSAVPHKQREASSLKSHDGSPPRREAYDGAGAKSPLNKYPGSSPAEAHRRYTYHDGTHKEKNRERVHVAMDRGVDVGRGASQRNSLMVSSINMEGVLWAEGWLARLVVFILAVVLTL